MEEQSQLISAVIGSRVEQNPRQLLAIGCFRENGQELQRFTPSRRNGYCRCIETN